MAKFQLILRNNTDHPGVFDPLECTCDLPSVTFTGEDAERLVNAVKGSILFAIANQEELPDTIEFVVKDER